LWEADAEPAGFKWLDANDATESVVAFLRLAPSTGRQLICVCNFSLELRADYRLALPRAGHYHLLLNTDAEVYNGGGAQAVGSLEAEAEPHGGLEYSAVIALPPLTTLWFEAPTD
jgi:1,4-alpha-glucan branching enzyme